MEFMEFDKFEKAEDVVKFTVSKRYWYLRNNTHECPSCKIVQQLSQFWNGTEYQQMCKKCTKMKNDKETYDIVYDVLSKINLEDL